MNDLYSTIHPAGYFRGIVAIIILSSLLVLTGCPSQSDDDSEIVSSLSVEAHVDSLVAAMSLREKVCEMIFIRPEALLSCNVPSTSVDSSFVHSYSEFPVGGFCLFADNIIDSVQLCTFNESLHSLGDNVLICVDEEGGRVLRVASNPSFGLHRTPHMNDVAASGRMEDVYDDALYIGSYLKRYGFDIDFAPVADVNTNPDNVIIGKRAFSDSPEVAAPLVVKYLEGLGDAGIKGCVKHFPGHGDVSEDTHTSCATTHKTWQELLDCEIIPFKAGIDAGVKMVMTAHIAAPEVTGNDMPSTLSSVILQDKLRRELGFCGVIVTDSMGMAGVASGREPSEAAVDAVKAGADILLLPPDLPAAVDALIDAVSVGEISEQRINDSVRRILFLKYADSAL